MQSIIDLASLPHLVAALSLRASNGQNNCVQRSAALMLDLTGATLVFGIVRAATPQEQAQIGPQAATAPFIHAWVEHRGELYSPTQVRSGSTELRANPIDAYYSFCEITRTWRLEHKAFMQIARRYRLSSAFRHNSARAGHGEVADALLRAAGVKYVLSERRTILPA